MLITVIINDLHVRVGDSSVDPESLCIDGNFTHTQQIHSRLDFIRFLICVHVLLLHVCNYFLT